MPCSSSDGMGDAYRTDPDAQRRLAVMEKRNHDLTQMLCSLVRLLNDTVDLPADVCKWYEEHQAFDRSQGR